jgi:hypothetical protein
MGVAKTPGIPCALSFSRVGDIQNSGASYRENADGRLKAVIPGRRASVEPGIHNHQLGVWIPGSLVSLAPRNDGLLFENQNRKEMEEAPSRPYSAISTGRDGPASCRSSIAIMQIAATTIKPPAAPNT